MYRKLYYVKKRLRLIDSVYPCVTPSMIILVTVCVHIPDVQINQFIYNLRSRSCFSHHSCVVQTLSVCVYVCVSGLVCVYVCVCQPTNQPVQDTHAHALTLSLYTGVCECCTYVCVCGSA